MEKVHRLFVTLPEGSVITLRLQGVEYTGDDIQAILELKSGIPARSYDLLLPDNNRWNPQEKKVIGKDISSGSLLPVQLLQKYINAYNIVKDCGKNDPVEELLLDDCDSEPIFALFLACSRGRDNIIEYIYERGKKKTVIILDSMKRYVR